MENKGKMELFKENTWLSNACTMLCVGCANGIISLFELVSYANHKVDNDSKI
jgi:hypothetical protein